MFSNIPMYHLIEFVYWNEGGPDAIDIDRDEWTYSMICDYVNNHFPDYAAFAEAMRHYMEEDAK